MCAITASLDTNRLKELVKLNSYRGSYSHSISYYNIEEANFTMITKSFGAPDIDSINIPERHYGIVHVQAPTSERTDNLSIHPSIYRGSYLWHNGILKPKTINYLQRATGLTSEAWDTALLHRYVADGNLPNDIDGSFSCLWFDDLTNKLKLFRNQISPMFYNDKLDISSTNNDSMYQTEPDTVYWIDLDFEVLIKKAEFRTANNPYFW